MEVKDEVRPERAAPADKGWGYALAVVLAYVLARGLIYRAMPAPDFAAWFRRDCVMSAPRLLGLAACLWRARAHGGWRRWGWRWSATAAGAGALCLAGVVSVTVDLCAGTTTHLSAATIAIGWLTTGPVALFEEAAFRSTLFLSWRRAMSPRRAALLSSAVFALYHLGVQPLWSIPAIFAFGLACCAALESGTGLAWLVAAHWLVDGAWFHLSAGPALALAPAAQLVAVAATIFYSLAVLHERPTF